MPDTPLRIIPRTIHPARRVADRTGDLPQAEQDDKRGEKDGYREERQTASSAKN